MCQWTILEEKIAKFLFLANRFFLQKCVSKIIFVILCHLFTTSFFCVIFGNPDEKKCSTHPFESCPWLFAVLPSKCTLFWPRFGTKALGALRPRRPQKRWNQIEHGRRTPLFYSVNNRFLVRNGPPDWARTVHSLGSPCKIVHLLGPRDDPSQQRCTAVHTRCTDGAHFWEVPFQNREFQGRLPQRCTVPT